ncbi:MAG: GNAT family N-acetyltransferase [Bacillus sp. (in: firmicutes)]
MSITLLKLPAEAFSAYKAMLVKEYAQEKVEAGTWLEDESIQKAEEETNKLLPNGVDTENHYVLQITHAESKKKIGYLWYFLNKIDRKKEAFIYDFSIDEEHQGNGFGTLALTELENHIKQNGGEKIALHVFAHNKRAIHLYNKLNFEPTDITMRKKI